MRQDRYPYSNESPGTFRVVAWTLAIVIITIKTLAALARIAVRTVEGFADARSTRA